MCSERERLVKHFPLFLLLLFPFPPPPPVGGDVLPMAAALFQEAGQRGETNSLYTFAQLLRTGPVLCSYTGTALPPPPTLFPTNYRTRCGDRSFQSSRRTLRAGDEGTSVRPVCFGWHVLCWQWPGTEFQSGVQPLQSRSRMFLTRFITDCVPFFAGSITELCRRGLQCAR